MEAWVTSIVYYNAEFVERIDRLRCFSTFLDAAGVRFALVLILIAGCLGSDRRLRANTPHVVYLLLSSLSYWELGQWSRVQPRRVRPLESLFMSCKTPLDL